MQYTLGVTKTARAAAAQAEADRFAAGFFTDEQGHQHAPCALCRTQDDRYTDCSTFGDAANPLAYCGDCGNATCPDHRDENDPATRCTVCAAAR
jgi:hypothetical protein